MSHCNWIFPLPSKARLFLFFVFLSLIAGQTYIVLHIEQKIADEEGKYTTRVHPKDSK